MRVEGIQEPKIYKREQRELRDRRERVKRVQKERAMKDKKQRKQIEISKDSQRTERDKNIIAFWDHQTQVHQMDTDLENQNSSYVY